MKRKLTIGLLIMVLTIWGVIFYRVLSQTGNRPTVVSQVAIDAPLISVVEIPEDDSLLLDYPDPFLGEQEEDVAPRGDFETVAYNMGEEIAYIDWSQVQYLGTVQAADGKRTAMLININGREFMLKPGDSVDGYTILRKKNKALVISYQGQTNTIYQQGGIKELGKP
ncbi:hypothetical protein [Parapedobacter sp. 10938]|uniref:hypothetical protein n=1 Tax=Parapedobacter flavus TaxID=3110225 RepID=UPI002DB77FC5|nr:hypothetical protein [Parapedobacter sp. 10938]MEC3882001.1 hypothetical protein [Parapedobacter sp. 10938]